MMLLSALKGENPVMIKTFKGEVSKYITTNINYIVLKVPPVTGAIIWAIEELNGKNVLSVRQKIIDSF